MKYNVHIDQRSIIQSGLDIDFIEGAVLYVIHGLQADKRIQAFQIDGIVYSRITPSLIQKELPTMRKKADTFYRIMLGLIKKGLLLSWSGNKANRMSFYALSDLSHSLYRGDSKDDGLNADDSDLNPTYVSDADDSDSDPTLPKESTIVGKKVGQKDSDLNPTLKRGDSDSDPTIRLTKDFNNSNIKKEGDEGKRSYPEGEAVTPDDQHQPPPPSLETLINNKREMVLRPTAATRKRMKADHQLSDEHYDILVNAFFDTKLSDLEAGNTIDVEDLITHCRNFIKYEKQKGTHSLYHPSKRRREVPPGQPRPTMRVQVPKDFKGDVDEVDGFQEFLKKKQTNNQ